MSLVKALFDNQGFNDVINNSDWNGTNFRRSHTIDVAGLYRVSMCYLKSAGSYFAFSLNGTASNTPRFIYITLATVGEQIDVYLDAGDVIYFEIGGVASGSSDNGKYSVVKVQ
ncbi:MAG: hypothetical protein RLO17_14620 [Cyclobacteriaceae bacterium]